MRTVATLLVLATLTMPLAAQETPQVPVAARFLRVNVRSGPGVDFTRIGQITSGERFLATGRSDEDNNWLRIDFEGDEGWVAYFTMWVEGDVALLPVEGADQPQRIVRQPDDVLAQAFRIVNVRREPTMRSEKIEQLFPGDEVVLLGRDNKNNDWLLIDLDGTSGWVAYFTVTVIGDVNRLAIAGETHAPGTESHTHEDDDVMAHVFRTVNVRQGPGTQFSQIGQLISGDEVDITGRSDASNNWLQVDFAGQAGWIAYFTVTVTGDPNTLPVVEQSS